MSVYKVDFRNVRHRKVAKRLLNDSTLAIEDAEMKVAGYVLIAWDDDGRSSSFIHAGGPITLYAMDTHVHTCITKALTKYEIRNEF